MNVQAEVAIDKQKHPEHFCPYPRCLWKTTKLNHATQQHEGGGYCPRHKPVEPRVAKPKSTVMDWIRAGCKFPERERP